MIVKNGKAQLQKEKEGATLIFTLVTPLFDLELKGTVLESLVLNLRAVSTKVYRKRQEAQQLQVLQ